MNKIIITILLCITLLGCRDSNSKSNNVQTKQQEQIIEDKIPGVFIFKAYSNGYRIGEKKSILRVFYNDGTYLESNGEWQTNMSNQKYDFGYVYNLSNAKAGNYQIINNEIVIEGQRSLFDKGDGLYSKPFEKEFGYIGYYLNESVMEVWKRYGYYEKYSNLEGKKPSKNQIVIIF
jgi:hypothetical protein